MVPMFSTRGNNMKEHLGKIVAVVESEMSITDGTTKPRTRIVVQMTAANGKTIYLGTKAFALNLREGCGLRSIMEGYTGTTDSKMMMQTMTRMGLLDGNQFRIGKLVGKDVWVMVKRVEKGDKIYHDIDAERCGVKVDEKKLYANV